MTKLFGWLTGFRKFIVIILFFIIIVVSRWVGFISDGNTYATVLRDAVVAFFGTNFGEHLVLAAKDAITGLISKKKDG